MRTSISYIVIFLLSVISCEKECDYEYALDINDLKCTWRLERFIDKTSKKIDRLPENYSSGFTFHGKDCIHVIGPCNGGPGKYQRHENKIVITKLAMTERYCQISGYEDLFTSNLTGTYVIDGNQLTIISDNDTDLVLTRADSTLQYDCIDF